MISSGTVPDLYSRCRVPIGMQVDSFYESRKVPFPPRHAAVPRLSLSARDRQTRRYVESLRLLDMIWRRTMPIWDWQAALNRFNIRLEEQMARRLPISRLHRIGNVFSPRLDPHYFRSAPPCRNGLAGEASFASGRVGKSEPHHD